MGLGAHVAAVIEHVLELPVAEHARDQHRPVRLMVYGVHGIVLPV